jgi:hypothetical protein
MTGHSSLVGMGATRVSGFPQWMSPFNAYSAANWIGMFAQRYMHEFGLTREQLGPIPLACRRHASLNPVAIYRDPLTVDDYLSARMISTPFCILRLRRSGRWEHGGGRQSGDAAPDLPKPSVRIDAAGLRLAERFP